LSQLRNRLEKIKHDDVMIAKETVEALSTMELRAACNERGYPALEHRLIPILSVSHPFFFFFCTLSRIPIEKNFNSFAQHACGRSYEERHAGRHEPMVRAASSILCIRRFLF
jgi:hypothetical protein